MFVWKQHFLWLLLGTGKDALFCLPEQFEYDKSKSKVIKRHVHWSLVKTVGRLPKTYCTGTSRERFPYNHFYFSLYIIPRMSSLFESTVHRKWCPKLKWLKLKTYWKFYKVQFTFFWCTVTTNTTDYWERFGLVYNEWVVCSCCPNKGITGLPFKDVLSNFSSIPNFSWMYLKILLNFDCRRSRFCPVLYVRYMIWCWSSLLSHRLSR